MAKKVTKKAAKRAAKRAPRKRVSKVASRRVAGVAGRDLPELPNAARALSRKYGVFW